MRWSWSLLACAVLCAVGSRLGQAAEKPAVAESPAEAVLGRWERASAGLLAVGQWELQRLMLLHRDEHSAHAIALVGEFRGPISAQDLNDRFDWTCHSSSGSIVLTGQPLDEVEQLFFERLELTLDANTHLPTNVQFFSRQQPFASEPLAVITTPGFGEPNRFVAQTVVRPVQTAENEPQAPRIQSPVRLVEHVVLKFLRPEQEPPRLSPAPTDLHGQPE